MPILILLAAGIAAGLYKFGDVKLNSAKSLEDDAYEKNVQLLIKEAIEYDSLDVRCWVYNAPKSKDEVGEYGFTAKRVKPSELVLLGETRKTDGKIVRSVIEIRTEVNKDKKVESTRTPFYVTEKNFKILQEIVSQVKGSCMIL
jgi:hypothetical protein